MTKKAQKSSLCQATKVKVKFTPGEPGMPGKWTFPPSPPRVRIRAGTPSIVCYQLCAPRPADWGFKCIAICEMNAKDSLPQTDYIELSRRCKPTIEICGVGVEVAFRRSPERIAVKFDGSLDKDSITLGVLLGVSNGKECHLSADPQIILDRDPSTTPY